MAKPVSSTQCRKTVFCRRQLALVHKRFRTPWINTVIVGFAAMGAAGFMSLDTLGDLTNVGSLAAFALVCITVIYLRISEPGLVRPFKTPLYPLTPVLGATMCLLLLMSLMATPTTRAFSSFKILRQG